MVVIKDMVVFLIYFLPGLLLAIIMAKERLEQIILTFALAPFISILIFFPLSLLGSVSKFSVGLAYSITSFLFLGILLFRKDGKPSRSFMLPKWICIPLILISIILILFSLLYPYFKQYNIHAIDILEMGRFLAHNGTFPQIPSSHIESAEVPFFYPPIVSFFIAFISLFSNFRFPSFSFSLFPVLYTIGYFIVLFGLSEELGLKKIIPFLSILMILTSKWYLSETTLEITQSLFVPFSSAFFLYTLLRYIKKKGNFFLLSLAIGLSFWVRIYLGVLTLIFSIFSLLFLRRRSFSLKNGLILLLFITFGLSWYIFIWNRYGSPVYPFCLRLGNLYFTGVKDSFSQYISHQQDLIGYAGSTLLEKLRIGFFNIGRPFSSRSSFFNNSIGSFINGIPFNPLTTLFFLISLFAFFFSNFRKKLLIPFAWTILVFLFFLSTQFELKSYKFFLMMVPSFTIISSEGFLLSLKLFKKRLRKIIPILFSLSFFLCFLISVMTAELNTPVYRWRSPYYRFPDQKEAFYRQFGDVNEVVFYIKKNIKPHEKILYLGRGEKLSIVSFLLEKGYIWEELWYTNPWAKELHQARSKREVMEFLKKNGISYVLTTEKGSLKREVIDLFQSKDYPQKLPYLLLESDPEFILLVKTEKMANNLFLYRVSDDYQKKL